MSSELSGILVQALADSVRVSLPILQIDTLSELARKKGISMRNATKQDLVSQLSRVLKKSDLSKVRKEW